MVTTLSFDHMTGENRELPCQLCLFLKREKHCGILHVFSAICLIMFNNFLGLLLHFSKQPKTLAFQPITENNYVMVGHVWLVQLYSGLSWSTNMHFLQLPESSKRQWFVWIEWLWSWKLVRQTELPYSLKGFCFSADKRKQGTWAVLVRHSCIDK